MLTRRRKLDKADLISDRCRSIPRAMLSKKYISLISVWETLPRIKTHPESCTMWMQDKLRRGIVITAIDHRAIGRIDDAISMTVWKSEVTSLVGDVVKLISWDIVSHLVSTIVSKPHIISIGIPVKTDSISHTIHDRI